MQVVVFFAILAIFSINYATCGITKKSTEDEAETSTVQTLNDTKSLPSLIVDEEAVADSDSKRSKKSATTTFCVEIKPQDQKPYQVCEPSPKAEYHTYPAPAQSPSSYDSGYTAPAKPAVYAQKSYSAPAPATAAAAHGANSYSSYRNVEEEEQDLTADMQMRTAMDEEMMATLDDSMMQMRLADMEEQHELDEVEHMRAAERSDYGGYGAPSYGKPTYGAAYGAGLPYGPAKTKANAHSGVVITCQPNLAGYAHGGHGYGAGAGYGSYRSSDEYGKPYSYGLYYPPAPYKAPATYGGAYKAPSKAPAYKSLSYSAPAPSYAAPVPSYSAPSPSFSAPVPSYSAPAPSYAAPAPSYAAPAPSYTASAPAPSYAAAAPSYSAPVSSYAAPAPSYAAPAPSYAAPAPSYSAPAPSYAVPAPSYSAPAPSYAAPAPSYAAPAPSYAAPAPAYSAPAAPAAPAPSYSAPAYSASVTSYKAPSSSYAAPAPAPISYSSYRAAEKVDKKSMPKLMSRQKSEESTEKAMNEVIVTESNLNKTSVVSKEDKSVNLNVGAANEGWSMKSRGAISDLDMVDQSARAAEDTDKIRTDDTPTSNSEMRTTEEGDKEVGWSQQMRESESADKIIGL